MTVRRGDCVEVMSGMEPDSVDAIVTDPPYGLEFMGKEWDRIATVEAVTDTRNRDGNWTSKPFGGAGQRVRYGSDSAAMERWHHQWATAALRVAKPGAYLLAFGGTRTVHRMTCALEDAGWVIRDMLVWAYASGFPKSRSSLKPAWEPIVLARKPGPLRELNIDAARIPGTKPVVRAIDSDKRTKSILHTRSATGTGETTTEGRWPANVILTAPIFDGGWDGVVGGGETTSRGHVPSRDSTETRMPGWGFTGLEREEAWLDTGTYSRFFLIPKAPTRERRLSDGRRSPHPTQKPEALIRHIVTLVTPPGGLVLDPFLGSGTLGVVAEGLGVRWVGIEREPEYADWSEDRIADNSPAWEAIPA
jgi:DNA modification methylase